MEFHEWYLFITCSFPKRKEKKMKTGAKLRAVLFLLSSKRKVILYLLALLCTSAVTELAIYYWGVLPGKFYGLLLNKDRQGVQELVAEAIVMGILVGLLKSGVRWMGGHLALEARQALTALLLDGMASKVPTADQRICQDAEQLCMALRSSLETVVMAPVLISYYSFKALSVGGYIAPLLIYIFFFVSLIICRLATSQQPMRVAHKDHCEGNFRRLCGSVALHQEDVKIIGSQNREKELALIQFNHLFDSVVQVLRWDIPINALSQFFSYFGSILTYIVIAIPIFAGSLEDKTSAELATIISQNSFFCMYLIFQFTSLTGLAETYTELVGAAVRVHCLITDIEREKTLQNTNQRLMVSLDSIQVKNLKVCIPEMGVVLLSGFNLEITLKKPQLILITGSNGTGKTSLMKCLAGVWPRHADLVSFSSPSDEIMFFPQTPYIPMDHSLRNQVTYPSVNHNFDPHDMNRLLIAVGLENFINGSDRAFDQALSVGERQRLVWARMLYHRPKVAFLDEPFSGIGNGIQDLIRAAFESSITLVLVGHYQNSWDHLGYPPDLVIDLDALRHPRTF